MAHGIDRTVYPYQVGVNYCVECHNCNCDNPETDIITKGKDRGKFTCRCRYKDCASVYDKKPEECRFPPIHGRDAVSRRNAAFRAYLAFINSYLITFIYTTLKSYYNDQTTYDEEESILRSFVMRLHEEYLDGRFGADYDLFGKIVADNLFEKDPDEKLELAIFLRENYLLDILTLLKPTDDEELNRRSKLLAAEKYRIMFERVCMENGMISPTFAGDKFLSLRQV